MTNHGLIARGDCIQPVRGPKPGIVAAGNNPNLEGFQPHNATNSPVATLSVRDKGDWFQKKTTLISHVGTKSMIIDEHLSRIVTINVTESAVRTWDQVSASPNAYPGNKNCFATPDTRCPKAQFAADIDSGFLLGGGSYLFRSSCLPTWRSHKLPSPRSPQRRPSHSGATTGLGYVAIAEGKKALTFLLSIEKSQALDGPSSPLSNISNPLACVCVEGRSPEQLNAKVSRVLGDDPPPPCVDVAVVLG